MNPTKSSKYMRITALISTTFLIASCESQPAAQEKIQGSTPFVFRSLDLKQRRPDGVRDWELTSPEARYNTAARTVRARSPKGTLFFEDKPSFMISAEHATVVNDGELVVLEGKVRLKRLGTSPLLIQGDRLIWRPVLSTMVISQRPLALNRNSKLVSNSLTFQQDSGKLLFSGPTKLSRWEKNYSSTIDPQTLITAGHVRWNLYSGTIAAVGPIIANQSNGPQLTAVSMQGNTKRSFLDLKAPVQFKLDENKAVIDAGDTRWDFEHNQLSSKAPISASFTKGNVNGTGFFIDIPNDTLMITNSCEIAQSDKNLSANSCSWNWKNDLLVAAGHINLKESGHDQATRADQIQGEFNPDGSIQSSQSQKRVKTQIKLEYRKVKEINQKRPYQVQF